jgi:hypothetical protein
MGAFEIEITFNNPRNFSKKADNFLMNYNNKSGWRDLIDRHIL